VFITKEDLHSTKQISSIICIYTGKGALYDSIR
jgi:hypothetical protein